ncbi:MAG: UDP-N-acetylglucosamine 2-epimerase [Planctomycetota bacterium]
MTRVCVMTGTRAEFGLLAPVMRAIESHPELELQVIAAGAHLLGAAPTIEDVRSSFAIAAEVPMQREGVTGRHADSAAFGDGVSGFTAAFAEIRPDWVLVLGDRIEAFAAASTASIGGIAVAHMHGGDRAEGIADEAMRHAITKLAHLHLAASDQSRDRIVRMGEEPAHVHNVGSPAASGIEAVQPLDEDHWNALGAPSAVVLHHPAGLAAETEHAVAMRIAEAVAAQPVLWLRPNHDPGRERIVDAIPAGSVTVRTHLPHATFRSLLRTLGERGGVLIGNSSSALIEAAMLQCPAVDIGPRQAGREHGSNVVHTDCHDAQDVRDAMLQARSLDRSSITHPFGDGDTPRRTADLLGSVDPHDPGLLRKRCTY